jgi:hypothetical protein
LPWEISVLDLELQGWGSLNHGKLKMLDDINKKMVILNKFRRISVVLGWLDFNDSCREMKSFHRQFLEI